MGHRHRARRTQNKPPTENEAKGREIKELRTQNRRLRTENARLRRRMEKRAELLDVIVGEASPPPIPRSDQSPEITTEERAQPADISPTCEACGGSDLMILSLGASDFLICKARECIWRKKL